MASAAAIGRAIPLFEIAIGIPERPKEIARREHNRICRESLKTVIALHHLINMPRHFIQSARGRYGYKPRKRSWVQHKIRKYGTGVDLVASGATRARMLALPPTIQMGGAAEGGKKGLEGKLILKFAFNDKIQKQQGEKAQAAKRGYYQRRSKRPRTPPKAEVTLKDMKRELRLTTPEERRELAKKFREVYMAKCGEVRARKRDAKLMRGMGIIV